MSEMDDISLAELLCARLCHDLSGPVGAASAGAELLEDGPEMADAETMELVAASAAGAAARLKFFRAAFGPPASAPQNVTQLRDLSDGYLKTAVSAASPGIVLSWRSDPRELGGEAARLLLNLVLLARDAMPRGGIVEVLVSSAEPPALSVTARGEPATLTDEARAVLQDGATPTGPRGAQALLARRIAGRLSARLEVAITALGLRLGVGRTLTEDGDHLSCG